MSEGARIRGRRPPVGEPVLERAFRLLRAFSGRQPSLSLSELSSMTGIPMSSALRLARQLVSLGALERSPHGDFSVGVQLLETASLAPRGHGLRAVAMPYMEDLHHATSHHVLLGVRVDDQAMLIERLSTLRAAKVMYRVGGKVPLHSTGIGLVLLANAPSEVQERVLARHLTLEPEAETVSANGLRVQLAGIRQEGVAIITRPWPEPATSVAAPVFGAHRRVIAALSVVGAVGAFDPSTIRPAVVAVARAISREASALTDSG